jgi:hypothetical protein
METVNNETVDNTTTQQAENTANETVNNANETAQTAAETAKVVFDLWVATQQKIVANWVESTRKFQEAIRQGDVLSKGSELYKEWFENQKQIISELTTQVGTEAKAHLPEFLSNLSAQQQEMTAKWMEMVNTAVKEKVGSAGHVWSETKRAYDNLSGNFGENITKMMPWLNGTIDNFKAFMPGNLNKDTLVNMMANTKAYMSMMEMWQPFYKMVTENRLNADEFTNAYNLQKYQEVVNSMFNFVNPDLTKTYFDQIQSYFANYSNAFKNVSNYPMKDMFEFFTKMSPTSFDFSSVGQFQQQATEQLKKIYEPYSKIIAPNKSKEVLEVMAKVQENLVQYQVKAAEMQHLVNTIAQQAMQKTATDLFALAKEGQSVESYNKFYTHWLGVLEVKMLELFNSEGFAKLQGELLALSLDIKASLEKNLELALSPLPVVPRSEVDELVKQIHDLKAKVKALEKAVVQVNVSHTEAEEDTTVEVENKEERKAKKVATK